MIENMTVYGDGRRAYTTSGKEVEMLAVANLDVYSPVDGGTRLTFTPKPGMEVECVYEVKQFIKDAGMHPDDVLNMVLVVNA